MRIHWHTDDDDKRTVLEAERLTIERLARCEICFEADATKVDEPAAHFENAAVFVIPEERDRLRRDIKKVEKELGVLETKLANPSFVERAPEAVVGKARSDASDLREKRGRLEAALTSL
ncbi:MAG: hypothetical protein JRF42_07700 [Deltaproteobacteria bacterium]|nr:hypothetical protein [Deltaproteobacteria bacterium]